MDCVILVPRRPERWRNALWRYVKGQVEAQLDWPVFEGLDEGPEPMNRAATRNRAAAEAGEWDVAVFLDADTVPDIANLKKAVRAAKRTGKLICPQDTFRSLTRPGTREAVTGRRAIEDAQKRWDYPNPKSSCVALSRELWESLGGYDERFVGWGAEDAALYAACEALAGVERMKGVCHHLWHPRSPEKNPGLPEYQANFALLDRYKAACQDREAMLEILGEPGAPLHDCGSALPSSLAE